MLFFTHLTKIIPEINPIINPPATNGTNPLSASFEDSPLDSLSIVVDILSINRSVSFTIAFAY